MANTFQQIGTTQTVSTAVASIAFTAIPATYTDLVVYISCRTSDSSYGSAGLNLLINGVSTDRIHYRLYAVGSSPGADTNTGAPILAGTNTDNLTANAFGNTTMYLQNYAGNQYKSWRTDNANANNSTSNIETDYCSGRWASTAAITSLTFSVSSASNFMTHSTFSLYGILKY